MPFVVGGEAGGAFGQVIGGDGVAVTGGGEGGLDQQRPRQGRRRRVAVRQRQVELVYGGERGGHRQPAPPQGAERLRERHRREAGTQGSPVAAIIARSAASQARSASPSLTSTWAASR